MLQEKTEIVPEPLLNGANAPVIHLERIAALEREVAQLREAVTVRQRYGVVTGVLAVRFGLNPERTWQLLVRLSQHTNTRMQVVARVVYDSHFGEVAPEDRAIADRLNAELLGRLIPLAWCGTVGRRA